MSGRGFVKKNTFAVCKGIAKGVVFNFSFPLSPRVHRGKAVIADLKKKFYNDDQIITVNVKHELSCFCFETSNSLFISR